MAELKRKEGELRQPNWRASASRSLSRSWRVERALPGTSIKRNLGKNLLQLIWSDRRSGAPLGCNP